jgi:hypothetical protein
MTAVKNHRRNRRIPYVGPVRISWEGDGGPRFALGRCIDLSPEGMRLEVTHPVSAGTRLQVYAERIRVSSSAIVTRMERCGSKYLLGLQLTHPALQKTVAELDGAPVGAA